MAHPLRCCVWEMALILVPEQQRFEHLCQEVSARLTTVDLKPKDLLLSLPAARDRVYVRRYQKNLQEPPGDAILGRVTNQRRIRLFLDSNVLTGGIVSPWGVDKATLSLCAAKVCKLGIG